MKSSDSPHARRHHERVPHTADPARIIRHHRRVFDNDKACEAKVRLEVWQECSDQSKKMEEECQKFKPSIDVNDENVPNEAMEGLAKRVTALRRRRDEAAQKNAQLKEAEARNTRKANHFSREIEKVAATYAEEVEKQRQLGKEAEDAINENTDLVVALKAQREQHAMSVAVSARRDSVESLSSGSAVDASDFSSDVMPRKKKGKKRARKRKARRTPESESETDSASLLSEDNPPAPVEFATVKAADQEDEVAPLEQFDTTKSLVSEGLPDELFRAPYRIDIPRRPPKPC